MSYTNKQYVTSEFDLKNFIQKSKKMLQTTRNGNLIIDIKELALVNISSTKRENRIAIIVNISNQMSNSSISGKKPGHWCVLCIQNQQCLFIDSLNTVKSNFVIMKIITKFYQKNNLAFLDFNLKSQECNNMNCGYQVLYYLYKFCNSGINDLLKIRRLFKYHSLRVVENLIMKWFRNKKKF